MCLNNTTRIRLSEKRTFEIFMTIREAAVWLSVISEFQAEVETCLENSRNIGQ